MKSDILSYDAFNTTYDPKKYISSNIMTVYEKTNLIGIRIEQLAFGAPSLLDDSNILNNIKDIAREELRQHKIPLLISRLLPNGDTEIWKTEDMLILN